MGGGAPVRRRALVAAVGARRIALGARDAHGAVFRRYLPRVVRTDPMVHPVVHLELHPRREEQVETRRRYELAASEELVAHRLRVRGEHPQGIRRVQALEWDVVTE